MQFRCEREHAPSRMCTQHIYKAAKQQQQQKNSIKEKLINEHVQKEPSCGQAYAWNVVLECFHREKIYGFFYSVFRFTQTEI